MIVTASKLRDAIKDVFKYDTMTQCQVIGITHLGLSFISKRDALAHFILS